MKLLSKEIFISLHTGKNGYPKQNLNIPHPNENSCHSTRAKNRYPKQNLKFPYPNEYSCNSTLTRIFLPLHTYTNIHLTPHGLCPPLRGGPACVPVYHILPFISVLVHFIVLLLPKSESLRLQLKRMWHSFFHISTTFLCE